MHNASWRGRQEHTDRDAPPWPTAPAQTGKIIMVDWARLLDTTGQVLRGMSDMAIVNNWLAMDDQSAYASIATQVGGSPTEDIDRLDGALLTFASTNLDAGTRQRLIKFYTVFKIVEFERYQKFRGFPQ
jgi:hypothetical protein